MSTLNDFDLNELVLQLHSELKYAFEVANAAEKQAGMQVESVKARLGRKKNPDEENNNNSNNNSNNLNILNSERYPDEEDWEIEVSYKYGEPLPGIPQSQNWVSTPESRQVLERLGNTEILNIKGVSHVWKERFALAGILNIEDLAQIPSQKIMNLCRQFHSLAPLEFQTKVLLLVRDFNPIIYLQFKNIPLHSLLTHTRSDLKKMFHGKLSGPEISNLQAMASIIYLVLDKRFTFQLKLDLLTK